MWNLTKYPLEDNYTTTLTQALSASWTTIYVAGTPNFTFPAWVTTYIVVNPWKTNQETIEVSAYDSSSKTFTVANRNKSKGASVTSTAQVHSVWSTVIISDNFQFWEDILTAINSKINDDWSWAWTSFDLQVSGSNFRIRKDWNDMKLRDDNNNEITLSQLSALSWADTKVAISANDTTPSQLESKLIEWDWISLTKGNAGGNENLTSAIDLDTDSGLEFNSGKLKTKSGSTTQKWIVQMATDAEVEAGTDEEKYVNSKQLKDNASKWFKSFIGTLWTWMSSPYVLTLTHDLWVIPYKIKAYCYDDYIGSSVWTYDGTNYSCIWRRSWGTTSSPIYVNSTSVIGQAWKTSNNNSVNNITNVTVGNITTSTIQIIFTGASDFNGSNTIQKWMIYKFELNI